jgi:hypothetical protein
VADAAYNQSRVSRSSCGSGATGPGKSPSAAARLNVSTRQLGIREFDPFSVTSASRFGASRAAAKIDSRVNRITPKGAQARGLPCSCSLASVMGSGIWGHAASPACGASPCAIRVGRASASAAAAMRPRVHRSCAISRHPDSTPWHAGPARCSGSIRRAPSASRRRSARPNAPRARRDLRVKALKRFVECHGTEVPT